MKHITKKVTNLDKNDLIELIRDGYCSTAKEDYFDNGDLKKDTNYLDEFESTAFYRNGKIEANIEMFVDEEDDEEDWDNACTALWDKGALRIAFEEDEELEELIKDNIGTPLEFYMDYSNGDFGVRGLYNVLEEEANIGKVLTMEEWYWRDSMDEYNLEGIHAEDWEEEDWHDFYLNCVVDEIFKY